jgi:phage terminase large subunit-like protein
MLQFGLRLGRHPRCLVATAPRPTRLIRELLAREGRDVTVTRGSTCENRANLAPGFFDQIIRKYEGTRLGRQELNAELLEDQKSGSDLSSCCRSWRSWRFGAAFCGCLRSRVSYYNLLSSFSSW